MSILDALVRITLGLRQSKLAQRLCGCLEVQASPRRSGSRSGSDGASLQSHHTRRHSPRQVID